ncbi:helix-turn-helix domain-containing protein [Actinokineospora sp. HUAS TT18]|uniref:helix-turn-helix domain-containing protein n=1 Tax=Actinokineospora sp. HUAS TT18 TaxID=3447451 RepID=UPI003F5221C5
MEANTDRCDEAAAVLLYTPAQAAALLQVRESWLRRRAGQRRVRCSFVGKHLRFSPADLAAIVADAARPARPQPGPRRPERTRPSGPAGRPPR